MGLFIRDDEVRVLAKRLAARRGQTVTEVVRQALKRACEEDEQAVQAKLRALHDIRARVGKMPELRPGFSDSDLYDEDGNPIL